MIGYFAETFAALPDFHITPEKIAGEGDSVFVKWRVNATFTGSQWQGIEPTGDRIELRGIDFFTFRGGQIVHDEVVFDQMSFRRQIGMLPAQDSVGERGMKDAFNARTELKRRTRSYQELRPESHTTRGGEMADRWFSEEELKEMSRPTMDRAIEAIEAGDLEQAKALCEAMKHEWRFLHDMMVDGIAASMSWVKEHCGEEAVGESQRWAMERYWKRSVQAIDERDRKEIVRAARRHVAGALDQRNRARSPAPSRSRRTTRS